MPPTVTVVPPLGYLEMIAAIRDAQAVVTDSGGVQREAYWLGTPCITLRDETEWTETVALGANRLLAAHDAPRKLAAMVGSILTTRSSWDTEVYGDGQAAPRIAEAVADWL